jgi:hypothetical protein
MAPSVTSSEGMARWIIRSQVFTGGIYLPNGGRRPVLHHGAVVCRCRWADVSCIYRKIEGLAYTSRRQELRAIEDSLPRKQGRAANKRLR